MNQKKTWSIVLIGLGAFLFIGGVSNYYDLKFAEGMMLESEAKITKQYGSQFARVGNDIFLDLYPREKVMSGIRIISGIIISIIGTLTIMGTRSEPVIEIEDDFEIDTDNEPSFKF